MLDRSFSMSAGEPNPLIRTLTPALANARAIASPIPLVDPVTTADLPVNVPIQPILLLVLPWQDVTGNRSNVHGSARARVSEVYRQKGAISGGQPDPLDRPD